MEIPTRSTEEAEGTYCQWCGELLEPDTQCLNPDCESNLGNQGSREFSVDSASSEPAMLVEWSDGGREVMTRRAWQHLYLASDFDRTSIKSVKDVHPSDLPADIDVPLESDGYFDSADSDDETLEDIPEGSDDLPRNGLTGLEYSGRNVGTLLAEQMDHAGYTPRWWTYKQARQQHGQVKRGSKGSQIFAVGRTGAKAEVRDGPTHGVDSKGSRSSLRTYYVFNEAQIEWREGVPAEPVRKL